MFGTMGTWGIKQALLSIATYSHSLHIHTPTAASIMRDDSQHTLSTQGVHHNAICCRCLREYRRPCTLVKFLVRESALQYASVHGGSAFLPQRYTLKPLTV